METLSLPMASAIFQVLGLPGLIFIVWHFDNKRLDKQREMYEAQQQAQREQNSRDLVAVLTQYREDVSAIRRLYENNIELVKGYEKLSRELVDTVRLNTQAQTMLVDWLKHRTPCHQIMKGECK